MVTKLGVLGAADSLKIVLDILAEYPDFECHTYMFREIDEILPLLKAHAEEVDMWLFTGRVAYLMAQEWSDLNRPIFNIPYKGSSIYKTLCEVFYSEKIEMHEISFDSLQYDELKQIFAELGISNGPAYIMPYQLGLAEEVIFQYHYELWQTGASKAAVTCMPNVHQRLQRLGVPSFRVLPARSAVESVLNMMLRVVEMQEVRDAQIAVQMFELDAMTGPAELYSTDEMYNTEMKVTQKLIAYAKKVQGSLKPAGPSRFAIFTTRGMLRRITDDFTSSPDLEEFEQIGKGMITCGIGIGRSAYEAEYLAAKALLNAKEYGKGSWMVFFDDKTVAGPLGSKEQITYSVVSAKLQSISGQTSISVTTLSKLAAIMRKTSRAEISAHELSQYMHILPRSARRIISALEKGGFACAVGEENPNPRGRPRKLYQINLGQEQ